MFDWLVKDPKHMTAGMDAQIAMEVTKNGRFIPNEIKDKIGGELLLYRAGAPPTLWVDWDWPTVFYNMRCTSGGIPNKMAMHLLNGLRRPTEGEWVRRYNPPPKANDPRSHSPGPRWHEVYYWERDELPRALELFGFMKQVKKSNHKLHKHVVGWITTDRGYTLLEMWAARNPSFARYLKAYTPPHWKEKYLTEKLLDMLDGGKPSEKF